MQTDGSAKLMKDFLSLKDQYAKLNFTEIQGKKAPSTSTAKAPVCESKLITTKGFNSNFTLPVLPPGAQDIIDKGVSPKPSGKLVEIKDWKVKFTVKNPDGTTISNLAVKPLGDDEINRAYPPSTPPDSACMETNTPKQSPAPTPTPPPRPAPTPPAPRPPPSPAPARTPLPARAPSSRLLLLWVLLPSWLRSKRGIGWIWMMGMLPSWTGLDRTGLDWTGLGRRGWRKREGCVLRGYIHCVVT